MFRILVLSAFGASIAVCVLVSALQFFTTEPLILHAEQFESASPADDAAHVHVHDDDASHTHDPASWGPAAGFERFAYTVVANFVVGFSVSLMLLGAMVLRGDPIDARRGLLWGIGGFAAVSLMPAFGLPPELPGTPAADILERQVWWFGTVIASAAGLMALVFARHWGVMAFGGALLIAPHVIGAPQPPSYEVAYPGALSGEFVVASILVSALLWSLSGVIAGWLHHRLSRNA